MPPTSLTSVNPAVVEIIEEFTLTVSPAYTYLVVYTMTGAIYLPFLVAIFYFSTASQRRSPIFFFVTLGVAMGIVQTAQADFILIHSLRHPFAPVPVSKVIPAMILNSLPTYIIDIALLLRVIAVYPPRTVSRLKFALIIGLPILLKILRVVEWILWSVGAAHRVSNATWQGPGYGSLQHKSAMSRVAMTVIDNSYITVVFLWRIRSSLTFGSHASGQIPERTTRNNFQTRIRTLFWCAVSNFVFPVPLLIAQLILSARDRADTFTYDILGIMVGFACVICAVFATIWRGVDHTTPEDASVISAPLRFRVSDSTGGGLRALEGRKSNKTRNMSQRYYHGELELGGITFGTLQPSPHTQYDEGSTMEDPDKHTASHSS